MSEDDSSDIEISAVSAFYDELIESRAVVLLNAHDHQTCVERNCVICRELAFVKTKAILVARDRLLDKVYDELLTIVARMDPQINSIDDVARVMKTRLTTFRELDPSEFWN